MIFVCFFYPFFLLLYKPTTLFQLSYLLVKYLTIYLEFRSCSLMKCIHTVPPSVIGKHIVSICSEVKKKKRRGESRAKSTEARKEREREREREEAYPAPHISV